MLIFRNAIGISLIEITANNTDIRPWSWTKHQ